VGYRPSTPSWEELAALRRRGQRPMGPVYLSPDAGYRARQWRNRGLYCLAPGGAPVLLAGLGVLLIAPKTAQFTEYAQAVAAADPLHFQVQWEGERWQSVI
jgi:hypothetical protein